MDTEFLDYEKAVERGKINRALARIRIHAARKRQARAAEEGQVIYERRWFWGWRKRLTLNEMMRRLPKAVGEK